MAALRGLGASTENSGTDDALTEANVYGSATMRQILKCTHYKRSLQAHIQVVLYEMAVEHFFQDNPHLIFSLFDAKNPLFPHKFCYHGNQK